jgi:hypothetical protein
MDKLFTSEISMGTAHQNFSLCLPYLEAECQLLQRGEWHMRMPCDTYRALPQMQVKGSG